MYVHIIYSDYLFTSWAERISLSASFLNPKLCRILCHAVKPSSITGVATFTTKRNMRILLYFHQLPSLSWTIYHLRSGRGPVWLTCPYAQLDSHELVHGYKCWRSWSKYMQLSLSLVLSLSLSLCGEAPNVWHRGCDSAPRMRTEAVKSGKGRGQCTLSDKPRHSWSWWKPSPLPWSYMFSQWGALRTNNTYNILHISYKFRSPLVLRNQFTPHTPK